MYRFFAVLICVIILVALVGITRGWFTVTSDTNPANDQVNVGVTVDKSNIRHDANDASAKAHELGENARRETQDLIDKIDHRVHDDARIHIDSKSITIEPGSKADLAVTRDSSDLAREQLGLTPSAGSHLRASGGVFEQGSSATTITIEAPMEAGARDGSVTVSSRSGAQTINVSVKPAPVKTVAPLKTVEVQPGL
jgi:hypothetical protein